MAKYILNPYYLGDSVILEPLARLAGRTLICDTPELFDNHPSVKAQKECHAPGVVLDMGDALGGYDLKRLYDFAGVSAEPIAPVLYLSKGESRRVDGIKRSFKGKRIGVLLSSRHQMKSYPYTRLLVEALRKRGNLVFGFDSTREIKGAISITGVPIRDLMVWLSAMDVVIGPDTGTAHIAAALGVPVVVIGIHEIKGLYYVYENVRCLTHSISPSLISVRRVLKVLKLDVPPARNRLKIGIMRLDGLGGTATLSDHAKKVKQVYPGAQLTLIVRRYADLFATNPDVDDIREVGIGLQQGTKESLKLAEDFDALADVRLAPAKWHQKKSYFPDDGQEFSEAYGRFPEGRFEVVERATRHHVLITDAALGLDDSRIETKLYFDPERLVEGQYIVVNNGVDTDHQQLRQTKCFGGWAELTKVLRPIKVIQVGTKFDDIVVGAQDLRGKTNLGELLSILKYAEVVICTEGGIMHLCAAIAHENVHVLAGPTAVPLFLYPQHNVIKSSVCSPCAFSTPDWDRVCPKSVDAVCMKTIIPERVAHAVMA